jgi:hypothetical protein
MCNVDFLFHNDFLLSPHVCSVWIYPYRYNNRVHGNGKGKSILEILKSHLTLRPNYVL